MTKSPKTKAQSGWTVAHPEPNLLDVTAPDGTVFPFYHDRILHWRFHAGRASRPDLLPEDLMAREIEAVLAAVQAAHDTPAKEPHA
jgi:hypothetical protein